MASALTFEEQFVCWEYKSTKLGGRSESDSLIKVWNKEHKFQTRLQFDEQETWRNLVNSVRIRKGRVETSREEACGKREIALTGHKN